MFGYAGIHPNPTRERGNTSDKAVYLGAKWGISRTASADGFGGIQNGELTPNAIYFAIDCNHFSHGERWVESRYHWA